MRNVLITKFLQKVDTPSCPAETLIKVNKRSFAQYWSSREQSQAFDAFIERLEAEDLVTVERKRVGMSHDLELSAVAYEPSNWHALVSYCLAATNHDHGDNVPLSRYYETVTKHLDELALPRSLVSEILSTYEKRRSVCGVPLRQCNDLINALRVAIAIASLNEAIEMRVLSARCTSDSKWVERHLELTAWAAASLVHVEGDFNPEELLLHLGVLAKPQPIMISAGVDYNIHGEIGAHGPAIYLGLPTRGCNLMFDDARPIVLVENFTPFHQLCELDNERRLQIVYTGGFPSREVLRLLKQGATRYQDSCTIYHWGDFDEGGFRILTYLAREVSANIVPVGFDLEEKYCFSGSVVTKEGALTCEWIVDQLDGFPKGAPLSQLRRKWLEVDQNLKIYTHEQEDVNITSVLESIETTNVIDGFVC